MTGQSTANSLLNRGRYSKARLIFILPEDKPTKTTAVGELIKKATIDTCGELEIKIISGKLTNDFLDLEIEYPLSWLSIEEVVSGLQSRGRQLFINYGGDDIFGDGQWLGRHLVLLSDSMLPANWTADELYKNNLNKDCMKMESGSKCLVTGGAGFIGSNLADELIARGHRVVILDNMTSGRPDYINPNSKFYNADICDREKVKDIFATEKFDYVFHLAAQIDVRKSVADPEFDAKINLFGGLNIVDNSIKNKVKKIFFSSTGGAVYGGATIIPTTEDYHPTNPLSPYGIHKLTFEKYLHYAYKVHGIAYTALRFANVYGQRQYKGGESGVVSIFVDAAIAGRGITIYGDGLQTRDYVYVGDAVKAFVAAMDSDFIGFVNIGTAKEVNLLELVAAIEKGIGMKINVEFAEERAGEERRSCLSYALAKEKLGWEPSVDFQTGLSETIKWSKEKQLKD